MTYGTNIYWTDTGAKKGGSWHPPGRFIPTNMKNVCAPICAMGEVGPLLGSDEGLPEVEGWGVL